MFMSDHLKFYINGEWVDSLGSETIEVFNPSDESVIGSISAGTKEDVDIAVASAGHSVAVRRTSTASSAESQPIAVCVGATRALVQAGTDVLTDMTLATLATATVILFHCTGIVLSAGVRGGRPSR